MGILTAAFDIDHSAVQQNYRMVKQNSEKSLLPLWIDLTNPSPALGWDSRERASLRERGPVDLIMALALIHHLAIANNVPWSAPLPVLPIWRVISSSNSFRKRTRRCSASWLLARIFFQITIAMDLNRLSRATSYS